MLSHPPISYMGAVSRVVEQRDHEGQPAWVIIASRNYDTTIEDLWDALTSPERIPRWFAPVSGDLRPGGRYQVEGNASGDITQCEPPRRFSLTWEYGGNVSWVNVRLDEVATGSTFLELEHIAHMPEDLWQQYGPGAGGVGWDLGLLGLALHIESGRPVDRAEAEAWPLSEEGREFARLSSEAWGQASVAAGTDEAAARAAAARTTAFYTGAEPSEQDEPGG